MRATVAYILMQETVSNVLKLCHGNRSLDSFLGSECQSICNSLSIMETFIILSKCSKDLGVLEFLKYLIKSSL